jgi:hypothetical protein
MRDCVFPHGSRPKGKVGRPGARASQLQVDGLARLTLWRPWMAKAPHRQPMDRTTLDHMIHCMSPHVIGERDGSRTTGPGFAFGAWKEKTCKHAPRPMLFRWSSFSAANWNSAFHEGQSVKETVTYIDRHYLCLVVCPPFCPFLVPDAAKHPSALFATNSETESTKAAELHRLGYPQALSECANVIEATDAKMDGSDSSTGPDLIIGIDFGMTCGLIFPEPKHHFRGPNGLQVLA